MEQFINRLIEEGEFEALVQELHGMKAMDILNRMTQDEAENN